ncbi:MAG: RluA family pseudouridine synthase [Candidatus Methylacidiphilales bacterium]|nr:RluA family pseudouridine synthase [Candidatus Methylacidiphilales bacterium]
MPKPSTVTESTTLLDHAFAAWPEVKKKQIRTWLKFQALTVNGRPTSQFDHPLVPGDVVAVRSDRYAVPKTLIGAGMKAWFEDAHLLVIDKPPDLLSIASMGEQEKTAYFQLTDYLRQGKSQGRERVWIVHRLDKETSGLMVFAKTPEAKDTLQSGWDRVEKKYEAVIEGRLPQKTGTFDCHLDERNPFKVFVNPPTDFTRHAVTHYQVLAEKGRRSLVELTLETGRRHQIRVHLSDAGCPIIGDEKYGSRTNPAHRLGLHATSLKFPHPATGDWLAFQSPMPKELTKLVR